MTPYKGAGKGYLSTFLAAEYGLNVVAIDCVQNNLDQLQNRARLMSKYYHHRVKQELSQDFYFVRTSDIDVGDEFGMLVYTHVTNIKYQSSMSHSGILKYW